ncbi:MAG: hypothetical protein BYD32DRAFT_13390 [Podila humilis]|nr:MAG: hypothetical protein BYD32DRAFT_13390 [Podila humilis]
MPQTRPNHVCSQTKTFLYESPSRPTEGDLKVQLPPKAVHPYTGFTSEKKAYQRPSHICSQTKHHHQWSMATKKSSGTVLKREEQDRKSIRSTRPLRVSSESKSHLRDDDNSQQAQSAGSPPMYLIQDTPVYSMSEKEQHVVVDLSLALDQPPVCSDKRFLGKAMDELLLHSKNTETSLAVPRFSAFAVRSVKSVLLVACTVGLVYLNMK